MTRTDNAITSVSKLASSSDGKAPDLTPFRQAIDPAQTRLIYPPFSKSATSVSNSSAMRRNSTALSGVCSAIFRSSATATRTNRSASKVNWLICGSHPFPISNTSNASVWIGASVSILRNRLPYYVRFDRR
jgi:hypothetical protein